ncbi:MAG TPA: hypothetical protein VD927_15635 [Chryseosolibacter sp.]|nr:hypothetical protein [Chryseosolibacter sp.]
MNTTKVKLFALIVISAALLLAFSLKNTPIPKKKKMPFVPPKGCVFRTVMGEESSLNHANYKTPEKVVASIDHALSWMAKAQNKNGGWGAGSHSYQNVRDPHAVQTDPATTAMVAMALLRSGTTLSHGEYKQQLRNALMHLVEAVENASEDQLNITNLTGTQIQTKLGANIDVILTSQFLSNVVEYASDDEHLTNRIKNAQNVCIQKIQRAQSEDGSMAGSGWAGVLQSSFASNALEAAEAQGVAVDRSVLEKAREFQKNNYNAKTGDVNTEKGAGIVLYSVTGSARASAKEARKVEEEIRRAKREGRIAQNAPASVETLQEIGYEEDEALKYSTAYEVYQSAKSRAQQDDVMQGFGNNGGEEFLSYLQTGESMIINKDDEWQKWYDNMSGRLLKIQNEDGSWNGHHCITSPVFCTATCLLILAVNNDVENLMKMGEIR